MKILKRFESVCPQGLGRKNIPAFWQQKRAVNVLEIMESPVPQQQIKHKLSSKSSLRNAENFSLQCQRIMTKPK